MNLDVLDNFSGLIEEKLHTWLQELIMHIPNVVVAFLIVFIFSLMARFFGKFIGNILRKGLDSKQIADLLTSIGKVSILIAGIFISLDFIGLKGTVTSLLAGAGIVGLAIGFAFQDMTENLIAGIAMGIRKPFQVGDVIRADSVFGTVKTINLRNTLVETFFGQLEIVPNKILFRNILTNFSVNRIRCIEIPVGISYADDPEEAAKVIVEQLNQCDFVIKKDETAVYAEGFGDSSINLLVWFWIDYPGETGFMQARHQAVAAINDALKSANILIPFPIRTLDFAIKGGEKLNAMLNKQSDDNQNEIN